MKRLHGDHNRHIRARAQPRPVPRIIGATIEITLVGLLFGPAGIIVLLSLYALYGVAEAYAAAILRARDRRD